MDETPIRPLVTQEQLVEGLKKVRDILKTRWCPKGAGDEFGNVCVAMAISEVTMTRSSPAPDLDLNQALRREIRNHLPEGFQHAIGKWNDLDTTTHEDVLNLMDKALAGLGALHE